MAKTSKRAKKRHTKPSAPKKRQEQPTAKKRVTALGRYMERSKVKK